MEDKLKKDKENELKNVKKRIDGFNKAIDMKDLLRKKDAKERRGKNEKIKNGQEEESKEKKGIAASSKQDDKAINQKPTEADNDKSNGEDVSSSKIRKFFLKLNNVWITREIAAKMGRDVELKLTLRDIIHFAIFFIFVTIVCMYNISKSDFYLTSAIKLQFDTNTLVKVNDQEEIWSYLEDVFIDGIYWKTWQGTDQKNQTQHEEDTIELLSENILIGAPRIKQVRVHNHSCKVHPYFTPRFKSCYGEYTELNEDKEPFGLGIGTAWTYRSPIETGSPKSRGAFSVYGGGGYYTDLRMSKAKTRKLLKELREQIWLNRGTRCVTINFSIYNGNLNLFSLTEFMFEFPPTGGVFTTYSITTVKVIKYVILRDYMVMSCELIMYAYLVYFAFEEARNITVLKWKYFKEFWSFVEISIIVVGFLLLGIGLFRFGSVRSTLLHHKENPRKYINFEYIADLMVIYNTCSAALLFLTYIKIFKYITFNKTMGQLNITLAKVRDYSSRLPFTFLNKMQLITAETFEKGYNASEHSSANMEHGMVINILYFISNIQLEINYRRQKMDINRLPHLCRKDVAGFSIMFMIIFIAFSALGHLLFGAEAESFNDFGYSMLTLLKTILGDFDYTELKRANPVFAPFFFILFIFLVFFVLLNMFLAIINDSYTDVKTEIAASLPELQMSTIISRGCFNLCRKLGCKGLKKSKKKEKSDFDITLEEIKKVLKSCGFTDLEIEMFFQRYNIDPTVKIDEVNVMNILEELKGKYSRAEIDEPDGPVVPLQDFIKQQNRIEKVEKAVGKLSNILQSLLSKIKNLESIRRVKMN